MPGKKRKRNLANFGMSDRELRRAVRDYGSGGGRTWSKYQGSTNRDTGVNQTNFFLGYVGEGDQRRKVHIAIDEHHNVVYVRDIDGTLLYDKKNGFGTLPADLDWS